jgi:uncharacterized protein (DUF433 family)
MATKYLTDRITIDDSICNGKPTVRGTRITVQTVLEYLGAGDSMEEVLLAYPTLEQADVEACLKFAAELLAHNYSIRDVA